MNVRNAVAKRDAESQQLDTVAGLLRSQRQQLEVALPRHIDADRFLRTVITTVRTNPAIAKCEPMSLIAAVMTAAQLGLEIDTRGLAYLVPFGRECTLVLGYQGEIELARRDGRVTSVYAYPVYQGDQFHYELGLHPDLNHVPSPQEHDDAELRFVYAVAHLRDAEPIFVVLSRGEVDRYRRRSKAKDSGPWKSDYVAMALKTAVHRLARWLPQSPDLATAASVDERRLSWSPTDGVSIVDTNAIETDAASSPPPRDIQPDSAADNSVDNSAPEIGDADEAMTEAQLADLHDALPDNIDAPAWVTETLGRDVDNWTDITAAEADWLITTAQATTKAET